MQNLGLVLLIFGFVCFVIACFQVGDPIWRKLLCAGMAFVTAAEIFGGISHFIH